MPAAILEADLRHLHLGSLLQLSESEFFSGHLVVEARGRIYLANGNAVHAEADGAGLSGLEALYELFLETSGPARIELDASVTGVPLAPTISLVMEGCRLLDEWTEIAELSYRLKKSVELGEHEAALSAVEPVVKQLRQRPMLREAVQASGLPRTRALGPVRTLIDAGILVHANDGGQVDTAVTPRPLVGHGIDDPAELLARGRVAFRAGQLEEAELLWSHALALSPNDRVLAQNLRLVRQRLERPT